MVVDLYLGSPYNGRVSDELSSVKVSEANNNEYNRIKFVTDLASVSRGKDESKNPEKRYNSLLREAAPTKLHINWEMKEGDVWKKI